MMETKHAIIIGICIIIGFTILSLSPGSYSGETIQRSSSKSNKDFVLVGIDGKLEYPVSTKAEGWKKVDGVWEVTFRRDGFKKNYPVIGIEGASILEEIHGK
jgi:hypothetical protein